MNRGAFARILVLPLVLSATAYAQVNQSRLPQNLNDRVSLRLQNSQYISAGANYFRDDASSDHTSVILSLDKRSRLINGIDGHLDLQNEYSATESWNYLNVYQAYGQKKWEGVNLAFGRKLEFWSATDNEWKQGIIHSRYMQNRLKPEPAGLFGFFAGQNLQRASWSVGVLPVFIPDFGAHFSVENHRFVSRNPWFDPPVSSFRLRGQAGEIRYSVREPPLGEIVLNPGLIGSFEQDLGRASGVRVTLAHKPVPQLLLGFPSLNRVIVGSTEDYLQVEVTPKVMYHSVVGLEGWAKAGPWTLAGGLTLDAPTGSAFDETYTKQTYSPAWIYALTASRPLEQEGRFAARVKLGLLKVVGGDAPDRGVFATEKSLFEKRFQYDEAYLASVHVPIRGLLRRPIDTGARVVYDRIQNGGSFGLTGGYSVAPRWRLDAEVELLGLLSSRAEEKNGFLSNYRANDRVSVGTSYVF